MVKTLCLQQLGCHGFCYTLFSSWFILKLLSCHYIICLTRSTCVSFLPVYLTSVFLHCPLLDHLWSSPLLVFCISVFPSWFPHELIFCCILLVSMPCCVLSPCKTVTLCHLQGGFLTLPASLVKSDRSMAHDFWISEHSNLWSLCS